MFENMTFTEGLALFVPLFAVQAGLAVFCVIKIVKEGVGNLNRALWLLIVILGSLIGPSAFLLFGRKRDY